MDSDKLASKATVRINGGVDPQGVLFVMKQPRQSFLKLRKAASSNQG